MKRWFLGSFVLLALGCSSNSEMRSGVGEPLLVRYEPKVGASRVLGTFYKGILPGSAPSLTDAGATPAGALDAGSSPTLQVTQSNYSERFVLQGQANVPIGGLTSNDVSAVAIALEGMGTGYWVIPVGVLDGATRQPTWDIRADFGITVPEGSRNLNYVGIDGAGNAGAIQSLKICVAGRLFDGYQGCVANPKPPKAAISLTWDANVDLDLQVMTPDGRLVQSKDPLTVGLDAGATTVPADAGKIDRDSNANCVIDGFRQESLVWQNTAPVGSYGIYVNLYNACKQPVVHFNVSVYTAVDNGDAGQKLQSWYSQDGILMDFQANGGSGIGLYVNDFVFQ